MYYWPNTNSQGYEVVRTWEITSTIDQVTDANGSATAGEDLYDWLCENAMKIEYELSGTWVFNDELTVPTDKLSQNINYYCMNAYGEAIPKTSISVDELYLELEGYQIPMPNGLIMEENYKTLYFVETPQSVSKEFYEWFTANATQQVYKLSGTWVFNDELFVSNDALSEMINNGLEQKINFTVPAIQNSLYTTMRINVWQEPIGYGMAMHYLKDGLSINPVYSSEFGIEDYKTIMFTEKQAVSKEFYEWFTANAVMKTDVTSPNVSLVFSQSIGVGASAANPYPLEDLEEYLLENPCGQINAQYQALHFIVSDESKIKSFVFNGETITQSEFDGVMGYTCSTDVGTSGNVIEHVLTVEDEFGNVTTASLYFYYNRVGGLPEKI